MSEPYDVIIVGGGPVGLCQALALTRFQRGVRVALLDRRPFSVPDDKRAFALSAGVRRVLEALGVWSALSAEATPIATPCCFARSSRNANTAASPASTVPEALAARAMTGERTGCDGSYR